MIRGNTRVEDVILSLYLTWEVCRGKVGIGGKWRRWGIHPKAVSYSSVSI